MAIEQRINKNGTESFRARVKDPVGKFYRSKWKQVRHEAMSEEAELLSRKRRGLLVMSGDEGKRVTFNEFWPIFQHENRTEVSDGWKMSQDQMVRDYIQPVIGSKLMADVGIPEIGRVLTRMKELGRGEQMRKHVYTLLKLIFDRAVNYYHMIPLSPVNAKYHRVKVSEKESVFLQPEQAWALLEVSRDQPAVWVELLAGLRTESAVALTWDCVQWDADQILIQRAWKSKVRRIEEYPKGKKAEYVPMASVLKEYLWERFQRSASLGDFVCPGPRGGMLKPETYLPMLKRLCRKAGVPEVSPHKLRHSCTEIFVQEGASQEDLRRLLNHKRGTTTLRYMHRTDDRLNAIAARIQRPELRVVPEVGTGIT
ncbi:MAG: tyrosine-type recombinase/integrase, partial [Bdellovibrionota bacterium]